MLFHYVVMKRSQRPPTNEVKSNAIRQGSTNDFINYEISVRPFFFLSLRAPTIQNTNVYQHTAAPGNAHIVNQPLINADLMQYPSDNSRAHSLDTYVHASVHASRRKRF